MLIYVQVFVFFAKFVFSSSFDARKIGCGIIIECLWLGLQEFGLDFDTAAPP